MTAFVRKTAVRSAAARRRRARAASPAVRGHPGRTGHGLGPWSRDAKSGRGVGRALAHRVLEVAAQEGYAAMQFNAVAETNEHAVRLWESLGFTILATVPEAFRHPDRGFVGFHIMHRFL